jgi:hypothetical protein
VAAKLSFRKQALKDGAENLQPPSLQVARGRVIWIIVVNKNDPLPPGFFIGADSRKIKVLVKVSVREKKRG